ncbi:hypothetical protein M413DRAFT_420662 [Hebeloma cylindrosporum]|uniref:HNH nuclease domain-containing protein n=1 Tax=Hebeloma cylindrosporum TaxID=76867 RepID=A0A0C2YAY7_HEBCY|nr:hypothetical protein M413DRAFT_420662 [Hebeloma cylindrosporum h7]
MTSLPSEIPERLGKTAEVFSAYDTCLTLEKKLQLAFDKGDDVRDNLIYVRILGYLIHYVPTDQGLESIIEEVRSCADADDSALFDVGKSYYDHFIRAFRANRSPIQTSSDCASPPLVDTHTDKMNDSLEEVTKSHGGAKKKALVRDGYRCLVTKRYDETSVYKIPTVFNLASADPNRKMGVTHCAHIFDESTDANIEKDEHERNYAATMWAVMQRFGYESIPDELNGSRVHRLENVMTLESTVHSRFDNLAIWFVATKGTPNRYKLEAKHPWFLDEYPEYVTFTTPDPVNLPVPSPIYLAIHAACAKVAHLSGAAKRIDDLYAEMEGCRTLDPDGASAMLLEHAISELYARTPLFE